MKRSVKEMIIFDENLRQDYRRQYDLVIISAATLVAGLFWQDALRSTFEMFLPGERGLISKYIAAVLITAVVTYLVIRLQKKYPQETRK